MIETISLWEECKKICDELKLEVFYFKCDYELYTASRQPNESDIGILGTICVISTNTLWYFHTALCLYYFKNKPDGKYISEFIKATHNEIRNSI